MCRAGKMGKQLAEAITQSPSVPLFMSESRIGAPDICGARVVITPSRMPDARTLPSSRCSRTSFSSGEMSMRRCLAFSIRKGTTSRLRWIMFPMAKSSSSSTAMICFTVMFDHNSTAPGKSPWANSAAFSAPMDVPYTPSKRTPSSESACQAPISYAPRLPPPFSTNARFMPISSLFFIIP